MESGRLGVRIERKSSIENEPRTLTIDQIQCAKSNAKTLCAGGSSICGEYEKCRRSYEHIHRGGANHSLRKGYLEDNLFVNLLSSDDVSDVAASSGLSCNTQ
ncbi:uncharacterized protein LOC131181604 isoform X1 [Hevea brasiliensis]|uniref:uncharacterized protein LOC131181604 isoform X1 n=1 Tax=Hevea brasiliensis TaxID=3981 RepID=UPI0025EBAB1F|nr:uncharacterized protein LOC131181604 isoform X1 [Hevea brasiliensis]